MVIAPRGKRGLDRKVLIEIYVSFVVIAILMGTGLVMETGLGRHVLI